MSEKYSRRVFLKGAAGAGTVLALAGPLAVLSGCTTGATSAPGSGGTAGKKGIRVLTLGEGIFGAPFVKLADQFTQETGIPVTMVTMGSDQATTKAQAVFAGKSSELDVIQSDYIFVTGYAKAGHIAPLDEYIDKSFLDDFYADVPASFKDMYWYQGHPVGLATIGNCQKFVYNEKALNDLGLAVPQTWADFLSASQKLVNPAKNQYGFTAGLEKLVKAFGVWLPIFWANGGELFDSTMRPQLNTSVAVDSLNYLLECVKTMPPGGGAFTESDEVKSMATGLATLDPVAWIPDAYTTADAAVQSSIKFAVQPKGTAIAAPVMGGLGLLVSSYSNNKAEAAKYVEWFNSKKVQSDLIVPNGGQPCRNSAWDANKTAKPWFEAQAGNLKVAKVRPEIPEWGQVDTACGTQFSRAFAGQATAQQALDQAQKDVEKIMQQAGYF